MYASQYWTDMGMPKSKLVIGMPTYGRSWSMRGAAGIPPPNTLADGADPVSRKLVPEKFCQLSASTHVKGHVK